jgi:3-carboxy-cis,cis-muconate cycloisomerase
MCMTIGAEQNGLFCGQIWLVRGGLPGGGGWWLIGRVAERFTDGRVPDPGVRVLFAKEYRWQCWLDVEAALAVAEAQCGVIPAAAAQAIGSAARLEALDVARVERGIAETSHPLMALVTELAMAAGEHGGWVHWGATTQNITQTGDVLVLREAHRKILRLLAGVLVAAADLAERTAGMLAAGRTHGQHAVPVTFGFKPAGWIDELVRHVARLRSAEGRVFTAMTGGAAGTFASLGPDGPRVQDAVAARLGLAPMAVPSRAIADGFAEYVCLLGLLGATGTRIALEVYQLMKTELAEAAEPAPPGTIGSSTMPHKRNPQLSDDCITIGARLRALVPLALEGMLHDHEVDGAHSAMMQDALQQACELSGDLLARLQVIVAGLEVDPARMRANLALSGGLISSEAVMLGLGRAIGRQAAHEVVYDAARATGVTFAGALKRDPRVTAHLDAAALDRLLDPAGHTGLSASLARAAARQARATAHDITTAW